MMKNWKIGTKFFLVAFLAASLGLAGCSGDDGNAGAPGLPGTPGADGTAGAPGTPGSSVVDLALQTPEAIAALDPVGEITGVTINSPPVVSFNVKDGAGRGITGLTSSQLRFIIAKLIPGTNGSPDRWQSYVNRTETPTAGVGTQTTPTTQANTESNGTLLDNGDGSYSYTFATDVATAVDPTTGALIGYDPSLTHRVAIQISGGGLQAINPSLDFVPAGGVVASHEVAMTASCNECHGELAIHGGGRTELKYCVTCHNPGTVDANSGNSLDMVQMVHKIHRGASLPSVVAGGEYAIYGFRDSKHDYSAVVMPTGFELKNCRKCHNGADGATPQGNNWMTRPSTVACGSCHDDIDFANGIGHLAQADDSACASCHVGTASAIDIEVAHRTNFSTENNPEVPAWAKIVKYEIASVTVDGSNNPVVKFRVLTKQNSADAFDPLDLTAANLTSLGMTGSPTFRITWSLPFGGGINPIDGPAIATPADWNNHGGDSRQYFVDATGTGTFAFDQPTSVGMTTAFANNSSPAADADGFYTLTLGTTPFPAGATRMGVSIESGFSFNNGTANVRLPGEAVIAEVGTSPRREIVSSAKCAGCHERLVFHGGSRHVNPNQCVICHNAEITNSGQITGGVNAEFSNNLKDMIHAIHAAQVRTVPFDFVRGSSAGGSGQGLHEFSQVVFFDREADCAACHEGDTYVVEAVPASASWSTFAAAPTATVGAWVPGANSRYAPVYAACFSCHDSAAAQLHFEANMAEDRNGNVSETCITCHGAGRSADVKVVHGN